MAFKKGQSGNPGGRPKEHPEVKALAREYTTEAVERLAHWMRQDGDAGASVKATTTLLERAWGKPEATINTNVRSSPVELTDSELAAIATGRSDGTAEPEGGAGESDKVH